MTEDKMFVKLRTSRIQATRTQPPIRIDSVDCYTWTGVVSVPTLDDARKLATKMKYSAGILL